MGYQVVEQPVNFTGQFVCWSAFIAIDSYRYQDTEYGIVGADHNLLPVIKSILERGHSLTVWGIGLPNSFKIAPCVELDSNILMETN